MKEVIERPCDMPIIVETLDAGKYVVKVTIAGEVDYLTHRDAGKLFRALFIALGELDEREDGEETKK